MSRPLLNLLCSALAFLLIAFQLPRSATAGLTHEDVYRILGDSVLIAGNDRTAILLYPATLNSGVISARTASPPIVDIVGLSGHPQWFAFVDHRPCAFFPHDAEFVFIDDVTSTVRRFPATNWPDLNGETLGEVDQPGQRFIRIVPSASYKIPAGDTAPAANMPGDYGDAPEDLAAYADGVLGYFPTHAQSSNGLGGGARSLTTGMEMLGTSVSVESDANDPADIDGRPNSLDGDSDDVFHVIWNPNTAPPTGHLLARITIAPTAPAGPRFVNAVMDFNRDGRWAGQPGEVEWVVQNQQISVPPGSMRACVTGGFAWPAVDDSVHVWTRLLLTRTGINPAPYGSAGWDGGGSFDHGEVEDAALFITVCRPDSAAVAPPETSYPASSDSTSAGTFNSSSKYVRIGPLSNQWGIFDSKAIDYVGLVISGYDNPGTFHARDSGEEMTLLMERMGFRVKWLKSPTREQVLEELDKFINPRPYCQSVLYVYIAGHSEGAPRQVILQNVQDPEIAQQHRLRLTTQHLRAKYDQLQACDGPGEDCSTRARSCDITTIVDVCNAGSWADSLARRGRRVFMSNAVGEGAGLHGHLIWPAWIHSHESWYASAFIKAALVSAQGTAKFASAREIHNQAIAEVLQISRNAQHPVSNLDACTCRLPPPRPGRRCQAGPVQLPVGQLTVIPLPITESFPVVRCEIGISITHVHTEDLTIVLRSPGGIAVPIAIGLPGTGFVDVQFGDGQPTATPDADGTYYGRFSPAGSLSAFEGQGSSGSWSLEITNAAAGFPGVLDSACLYLDDIATSGVPEGGDVDHRPLRWGVSVLRTGSAAHPFRIELTVPVVDAVDRHVIRVQLYDVAGRLIRNLHEGPPSESPLTLLWDGRDARGRPAGAGIYFLRLSQDGMTRANGKLSVP